MMFDMFDNMLVLLGSLLVLLGNMLVLLGKMIKQFPVATSIEMTLSLKKG